jgi:hypothetical protein
MVIVIPVTVDDVTEIDDAPCDTVHKLAEGVPNAQIAGKVNLSLSPTSNTLANGWIVKVNLPDAPVVGNSGTKAAVVAANCEAVIATIVADTVLSLRISTDVNVWITRFDKEV